MRNRISELMAARDMNGTELARLVGMHPHSMRRYIRNQTQPKAPLAKMIADIFSVSVEYVLGVEGADVRHNVIPLYGTVSAGPGSDITDMGQAIDHIPQPVFVNDRRQAGYACYVAGTSMDPRYLPGEIVYVNPTRPVRRGDYVVVQYHDGERHHAVLKKLVSIGESSCVLRQLNPDQDIHIDNVVSVHFVQGSSTQ